MYKTGFSKICVTPPLGCIMAGHPGNKRAEKILDHLFARTMAISADETTVVFTSVDVLFLHESTVKRIREECSKKLGIPASNFYLSSTHTHSGPLTSGTFGQESEADYLGYLEKQITASILDAVSKLQDSDIYLARARVKGVAFCERIIMKGGRVETHPFKYDEDIIGYESVADDELYALFIKDKSGAVKGCYTNFANHPQVMERENTGISADFPGRMEKILQTELGTDFIMLFGPGACGDICPVDSLNPDNIEVGESWCQHVGHIMAKAVLSVIPGAKKLSGAIKTAASAVTLTRRCVDAELLKKANEFLDHYLPSGETLTVSNYGVEMKGENVISLEDYLHTDEWKEQEYKDLLMLEKMCRETISEDVEINMIAIGDLSIVTVPFEMFSRIGSLIKERSPFKNTFVVELTNGAAGYLPTMDAFSRQGSYEVLTLRTSRFIPDSADKVTDAVIQLLKSVK